MKKLLLAVIFAICAITLPVLAADQVAEVSVANVQVMVSAKPAKAVLVDANNEQARTEAGMVPGAIKLSSYNQYNLAELPTDKNTTLVFYCYNSYCQASHMAAARALQAGYTDVRVMKAGIVGWNAANKKAS
ncbi:MAG: rhodanese-like domain-containing protein [Bdellovibrio sp.]|nr:rhodanese-like domain-containing protein [Methylotenera sp.]